MHKKGNCANRITTFRHEPIKVDEQKPSVKYPQKLRNYANDVAKKKLYVTTPTHKTWQWPTQTKLLFLF